MATQKIDRNMLNTGIVDNSNATAITIDSSEKVGIGTGSPAAPLDVAGNFIFKSPANTLYGNFDTTTQAYGAFRLQAAGSSYGFIGQTSSLLASGGSNTALGLRSENEFAIATGGSTERMRIDSSGNVGIGTSSIDGTLHLDGGTSSDLIIEKDDTGSAAVRFHNAGSQLSYISLTSAEHMIYYGGSGVHQIFWAGGSERMRIDSSGIVHIGTGTAINDTNVKLQLNAPSGGEASLGINDDGAYALLIQYASGNYARIRNIKNTPMLFETNNTEKMRIDASGNVGIGITDPDQALEIGAGGKLKLSRADNSRSMLLYTNNADCVIQSDTDPLHLQSANRMTFATNGSSERMRIDTSGNVGIGTSSPLSKMTIAQTAGNTALTFQQTNNGTTNFLIGCQYNVSNTFEITPSTAAGGSTFNDPALVVNSSGNVGIGVQNCVSHLSIGNPSADGVIDYTKGITFVDTLSSPTNAWVHAAIVTTGSTGFNGNLIFATDGDGNQDNDTSGLTERMRIDSSGSLLVGTTNSSPANVGKHYLTIETDDTTTAGIAVGRFASSDVASRRQVTFFNANGTVGTIFTNASATAYNTSSDYRLKENVDYTWNATTRLKQLKPARFNFIADADTIVDGFLAHEVSSIVPEAITGTKDKVDSDGNPEYQGIDHGKLVPLLVKTIQELEARITELEG
jgi:hypothetical protein